MRRLDGPGRVACITASVAQLTTSYNRAVTTSLTSCHTDPNQVGRASWHVLARCGTRHSGLSNPQAAGVLGQAMWVALQQQCASATGS